MRDKRILYDDRLTVICFNKVMVWHCPAASAHAQVSKHAYIIRCVEGKDNMHQSQCLKQTNAFLTVTHTNQTVRQHSAKLLTSTVSYDLLPRGSSSPQHNTHVCVRWPKSKITANQFHSCFPYSALTLLVVQQEGHPACKKSDVGLLVVTIWLELYTYYSCSCHHHLHHP